MTQAEAITNLVNAQNKIIRTALEHVKRNERRAQNAFELEDKQSASYYQTAASAQLELFNAILKVVGEIPSC